MGESRSRPDRWRVVLLMLGVALLLAAWVASTRPFDAPDEASHYQRALTITHGQILGPKVDYPNVPMTPAQQAFIDHDTRAVLMPARLSPPDVVCMDGKPDIRGSCLEADPDGNFPPLPYLLPAAALAVSHDATTGLWLTRLASAAAIARLSAAGDRAFVDRHRLVAARAVCRDQPDGAVRLVRVELQRASDHGMPRFRRCCVADYTRSSARAALGLGRLGSQRRRRDPLRSDRPRTCDL